MKKVRPLVSSVALLAILGFPPIQAAAAQPSVPGTRLWLSTYDDPVHSTDGPGAVAVSPDGKTVFVTAEGYDRNSDPGFTTIAYEAATGKQQWTGFYLAWYGPNGIAVSPDGGRVYVTGRFAPVDGNGKSDAGTIAYDALTGAQLWVARYNGPADSFDSSNAIGVSPDGSLVVVTGSTDPDGFLDDDYLTIAYDAATGTQGWLTTYDGPIHNADDAYGLAVGTDEAFVTGSSWGGTTESDATTVAYDMAGGGQRWVQRINGPVNRDEEGLAVVVVPDGSEVIMGGTLTGADYLPQYLTAAYDAATGRRLWTRLFAGQRTQVVDSFAGLAISPDGSFVVVTGDVCCMPVSHYEDWATVAYEAQTGRTVWMRTFNGPTYGSEDESGAVTIAPGSNVVVVAGNSAEGSNLNATTVAYDAGGATLWARAYDGPGHGIDASGSVATSPDGSAAFVSGSTTGVNGFSDILTIAYSLV